MNDACYRRIQMLRLIPKSPSRICVSALHDKLKAQGIEIDVRSVQRDLVKLSQLFAIENDGNKDIRGWYWRKDATKLELPEMEPAVALSFKMMQLYLDKVMPPSALGELSSYFRHADSLLTHLPNNDFSDWSQKIATLSRNQPLLAPEVKHEVIAPIYQGLLSDTKIKVQYQPRYEDVREYDLNPLGLVVVDQIIYLVGTLWEYQDVKQFALHRFILVENTDEPALQLDAFDLQDYIQQGHFEYLLPESETLNLKIKMNRYIAKHLMESKLSIDQTIEPLDNDFLLTATVKNTHQLRWWLMSFGSGLEVLEPLDLRAEFKKTIDEMFDSYHT